MSITDRRLNSQQITSSEFKHVTDLVTYMGAIQAQDYAGAKWAVGLRIKGITDADVDNALAKGDIIRTHVMRPTWHFVAPEDVRWMLELTGHRINALAASHARQMNLDSKLFTKCNTILEKALHGGKQLDRLAITALFKKAGIATEEQRLVHILMRAETDGVICSGGREGKQFTYALLDERVPKKKSLKPAEPLAELAKRYFISHGPATLQDYTWWSGLTLTDARKGLEMIKEELVCEEINGQTYWMGDAAYTTKHKNEVHLLPAYDEYTVAYKDRSDILDVKHAKDALSSILTSVVIINGKVEGTWKRTVKGGGVEVEIAPFAKLSKGHTQQIEKAAKAYADFLEVKGSVVFK